MDDGFLFDVENCVKETETITASPSPCSVGTVSEVAFVSQAVIRGFTAWMPFGHSQKADVVIWRPPLRPVAVQIKKAVWQSDKSSWKVMVGAGKPSCAANPKDYGKRYSVYEKGDFDILAAHIVERDSWIFWLLDEIAGRSTINWRPDSRETENWWEIFDHACFKRRET